MCGALLSAILPLRDRKHSICEVSVSVFRPRADDNFRQRRNDPDPMAFHICDLRRTSFCGMYIFININSELK